MDFASRFAFVSPSPALFSAGPPPPAGPGGDVFNRRARFDAEEPSTNVIRVELGSSIREPAVATGDPTLCGHCNAVMSHISKVEQEPKAEGAAEDEPATYKWPCEFCGAINEGLRLEPEELPSAMAVPASSSSPGASKGVDYLLVPGGAASGSGSTGGEDEDASAIVFVGDCSGSMCITTEITGAAAAKLKLRGAAERADEFAALRRDGDDFHQFGGRGGRRPGGGGGNGGGGSQWVSRLQSLQAAITSQMDALTKSKPNKRVGLVTFASDVTVFGDCTKDAVVLAGSRLSDFTALKAAGEGNQVSKPLKETVKALTDKVWGWREEGSTALGPALLVAVAMAGSRPGGRVVVCTDGLANQGLGSLEAPDLPRGASQDAKDQAAQKAKQEAEDFFARVQALALEKGVVLDVLGFAGSNCNLEALSHLSDATGGSLVKVDPKNILDEFSNVLAEEILATNVSLTMIGHGALHISDPTQDVQMGGADDDEEEAEEERSAAPAAPLYSVGRFGDAKPDDKSAPAAPKKSKARKESFNHQQLRQVAAALVPSPAPARKGAAAPSSATAGTGAGAPAAESASSASAEVSEEVQSVAGLLAQRHGLRAGKVSVAPGYGYKKAAPLAPVSEEGESLGASVTLAAPDAAEKEKAAPAPEAKSSSAAAVSSSAAAAPCVPPSAIADPAPDQPRHLQPSASATTLYIGNVVESSEATFEYRQKTPRELARVPGLARELDTLTALPFQLQIAYTSKATGACYLRIITASQPVTREAETAYREMSATTMVSHAARSAGAYAKKGMYAQSASVATKFQRVIGSNIRRDDAGAQAFQQWSADADTLTRTLREEVASERPKKKSAAPSLFGSSRAAAGEGGASASGAPPMAPSRAVAAPAPSAGGGGWFRGFASALGIGGSASSSSAAAPPMAQAVAADLSAPIVAADADKMSAAPMTEARPAYEREAEADGDDGEEEEDIEADDSRMAASRAARRANNDELAAQISSMMKGTRNYTRK